jgi:hypothetical protein
MQFEIRDLRTNQTLATAPSIAKAQGEIINAFLSGHSAIIRLTLNGKGIDCQTLSSVIG